MNRNTKHPDRKPHKRKAAGGDHKNDTGYRITGSWNTRPDRPFVKVTSDRKAARRVARELAEQAAYVIVEKHTGHGVWETWFEVDGPALAAERRRAEQEQRRQADAKRRAAVEAETKRQAAARRSAAERASLERLMTRPPVMRDATGRVSARHTAGA
ncbi:hypothetical protein OG864_29845 [Streptomyces sp. NBC_00124]|uniref:hypothetical protein n=1 Tax=Streptomyces sp. NBC_00124 TaxID=2975662 RepID=UPI00225534E7|nr:hypothetical protein [Streptomyces sp. NBC_00124]MCX5362905.1 hypothetical protein [Streptomyces sp. NBC_00124]